LLKSKIKKLSKGRNSAVKVSSKNDVGEKCENSTSKTVKEHKELNASWDSSKCQWGGF